MKGIFKKTLACAIVACALTSSVTAFAANGPVPDWQYHEDFYGIRFYKLSALNIPEVTKYSNKFTFKTISYDENKINTCDFFLKWQMYKESTGAKVGLSQTETAENTLEIEGSDSASLAQWGNMYAECYHEVTMGLFRYEFNTRSSMSF